MAAPQLRLEVSLNLLGFRNEIRKLTNIAQSEFVPKINVKFNRQTLDAELNNLQRAIKRRVYRVEIGGNIDALPSKIKNLKEQLASIESLKIDLGIGAVKSLSKRDASKIKSDLRAEILGEQKKIYVPVSIKPSIVKKDVLDFKNAVQSKLSGITVKVKADLEAASISGGAKSRADINADVRRKLQEISEIGAQRMAGGGGGVTEAARRAQLKRSLETGGFDIGGLKDIGKQLGVAGVGRFKNVNNLIEKIVTESSIEMVKKYLDPQAVMRNPDRSGLGKVLDAFARGIFNMLGMDPASIRAQQQSSKPKPFTPAGLLPAAYRGIGPSAEPAGLLPPAYRGIGPSRNAGALPGTAFGGQKYLPTALGEELKEVLRGAANAFLDSIRQNIRTVAITDMGAPPSRQGLLKGGSVAGFLPGRASAASVLELNNILAGAIREYFKAVARDVAEAGRAPISTTPLLSSASPRNQLMLPPAGGTTANLNRPRTTTGSFTGRGYEPPGGFASNGMLGGRQGPATFIGAGSQMEKFKTVLDVATASTQNFRASQIPLIGGIKSLAGEFGEATKQVLLYGTAYKGLAFLISLPGQVLNAAKSQQQFNNGLKVATQETGTFAKELLYVDNVQRAFGLNLETTRTGFTRLYASMSPTGFDSGSIEKLFTGISAATASLQLTPDKAERVIYAFGQMASKGQIMSEELKGQLGDVLPGALAIFSKAAGMSVKEFSKAMEDGEFVGTRFREVFAKVSDELMNRFGTGAQVAGRSLQGLINTVGGDFQRTLESFAPLANAAAQATLGPLTGMLREVSMAAQIAMGEQDRVRKQLEAAQTDVSTLKAGGADAKEIKAAEQNVAALAAKYEVLNEAARDPAIAQQVKNIEAFVAEVQKAATFTMNFAGVIGSVLSPLFAILGGNLTSVIGNLAALALGFNAAKLAALLFMGVMNAMRAIEGISRSGAVSVTLLTAAYRALGVQITAAQVATLGATGATTGFSLAIKGLLISTGIGAVIVLLGSLAAAFLSVGNSAKAAADKAKRSIDSMADAARTGNVAMIEMELAINKADRQDLEGLIKNVEELKGTKGARGVELVTLTPEMKREAKRLGIEVAGEVSRGSVLGSLKALRAPLAKVVNEGSKDLEDARKRAESLGMNKPDPGVLPPESPATGKPPKEQSLESYYSLQDQLAKNFTQDQLDRMEQEYQARVNRINSEFDLREARANSFQKEAIRFERQISDIELKRQKALLDASAEVIKAQGSVAGGAGGQSTTGATGLLQGSTGISSGAHFDVRRQDGSYISPEQAKALFDPSVRRQLAMTSAYGPRRAPVPGASTFHKGVDLAGPANTPLNLAPGFAMTGSGEKGGLGYAASVRGPSGEMYDVGHLQRPTAGMGTPRKVTGDEKRDVIADQKAQLAVAQQSLTVRIADAQAVRDAAVAWAQYSASIVPVEEQALQNDILAKKNELVRVSMPEDVIEKELKYFEAQQKTTLAIANNNKLLKNGLIDEKQHAKNLSELQTRLAGYNTELDRNIQLQRQQSFDASMGALQKQITMATPVGGTGLAAGFMGDAGAKYEEAIKEGRSQDEAARFAELQNQLTLLETRNGAVKSSVLAIGDAFATAMTTGVAGLISGTATAQEVFASFLKSIGDALLQAAQQMIATYIAIGIAKIFAGLGGGGGGGAMPGAAPQMTPGAIVTPTGFSGQFAGTAGNGATFANGIASFARGGTFSNSVVSSPTMFKFADGGAMRTGLMGEAGPEAIMPLSRGADGSLGVQANGLREAMDRQQGGANGSPVLNMSFQSTSINGVEYVSRDQLESAMAETRRNATRDGAKRGMTMTLDRIQNSSSTRRKVGI
jgi:tape measure domain-containing protein